jgi:hypothetical protein
MRVHRSVLVLLILLAGFSGCVTGSALTVPGEISRRAAAPPPGAAAAPSVAVLDFTWTGAASRQIGRDFDHARPIVWNGNPGKAMADLVVGALAEKGVAAVRAAGDAAVSPGVPARVWGNVEEFRVDFKRIGTLKVEGEAVTTLKLQGAGPGVPPEWSVSISTKYTNTDAFTTPEGAREALEGAANAAAEEAARRLLEAGVVSATK